eukprot:3951136-Ditylum_brightwellii.AAC.1
MYSNWLDEPHLKGYGCGREQGDTNGRTLSELFGISSSSVVEYPVHIQIGGCTPQFLGSPSAIGAVFGQSSSNGISGRTTYGDRDEIDGYQSINLNCGCPSNAVGRCSGGAILMRDPAHVAQIVECVN